MLKIIITNHTMFYFNIDEDKKDDNETEDEKDDDLEINELISKIKKLEHDCIVLDDLLEKNFGIIRRNNNINIILLLMCSLMFLITMSFVNIVCEYDIQNNINDINDINNIINNCNKSCNEC